MKHFYSLTILTCYLILISMIYSKHRKTRTSKKLPFNAGDVARDYYQQNTVNHIISNDLHQTAIDVDPSRYKILNGFSKENDPNMVRGEISTKYPEAYYPHYDPSLHPFKPVNKKYISRNKLNDIYSKDSSAYYGRIDPYRIIDTTFQGGAKVNIKIGDLTEQVPSYENVKELQKQLDNINRFISLPKELLKADKGRKVYYKDPNAYYDPTSTDLFAKKKYLENLISNMKKTLAGDITSEINANEFHFGVAKGKVYVENKFNTEREKENQYIKDSYHYDVPRNQKKSEKDHSFRSNEKKMRMEEGIVYRTISKNYKNKKNSKKEDKKLETTSNKKILNKSEEKTKEKRKDKREESLQKIIKAENKNKINNEKIKESKVAENFSNGKVENKINKKDQKNDDFKKEDNHALKIKKEEKIEVSKDLNKRLPDSQGFKIEKVKIISHRRHLD